MGYGEAIASFFRRYVDFNGRSSRSEYWWPTLTLLGLTIILGLVGFLPLAMYPDEEEFGVTGIIAIIAVGLLVILVLATLIPSIALNVRRLHDFNQTGWIYLGVIVAGAVISLVQFVAMIVIGAIEGTKGPNKYGPDPLNPTDSIADMFD